MPLTSEPQRWVAIARILRPRGNKGEVAVELLTDFPERLTQIRELFLSDERIEREPRRASVRAFWLNKNHRGQAVFHVEGCDSISEAERLRGLYVLLPIEQRVSLPEGQYFVSDLIGCSVFCSQAQSLSGLSSSPCSLATAPALLGTVSDVQFTGADVSGTPLLVVDTQQGELLIPLAQEICVRVDVTARRIDAVLPEGLREVNR